MSRLLMVGIYACVMGCDLLAEEAVDNDLDGYADDVDCDDADPNVHPDAPELCDDIDQDCDGVTDDPDAVDAAIYHPDLDNDGRGDPEGGVASCTQPSGYVIDDTDCDDTTPRVSPDVAEVCDGEDNDCDQDIDEPDATNAPTWHLDRDGDGFGDPEEPGTTACDGPVDHADNGDDCDDGDPEIHPDAEEIWYDDLDQDCDEWSDFDQDRDGVDDHNYGGADCDDSEASVHPDAEEICGDGIDNNCDGSTNGCGMHGDMDVSDARSRITGEESRDQIGGAIASAGDINGDALPDLLVDAQYSDLGGDNAGAVYLLLSPLPEGEIGLEDAHAVMIGEEADDYLGSAVNAVGDLNADGYDDIVLTSLYASTDSIVGGAVYVVLGPVSDSLDMADADARVGGGSHGMHLGYATTAIPDQDEDGLPDLVLTAPVYEMAAGQVSVLAGTNRGDVNLDEAALQTMVGTVSGDTLGAAITSIDLDGDGVHELLIGAPGRAPLGTEHTGVVYGATLPLPSTPGDSDWELSGLEEGDQLGIAILALEDVDGDGLSDLLIGAKGSDEAGEDAGAAYLFLSQPTDGALATTADAVFLGGAAGDALGAVMAAAGDLDGDGTLDIALGAPSHTPEETLYSRAGRVYIFPSDLRGVIDGEESAEAWIHGETADDEAGTSLTTIGDVNEDGNDDLLIGSPYHDTAGPNAGTIFLLTGGSI